jgi:hypothetical protein
MLAVQEKDLNSRLFGGKDGQKGNGNDAGRLVVPT